LGRCQARGRPACVAAGGGRAPSHLREPGPFFFDFSCLCPGRLGWAGRGYGVRVRSQAPLRRSRPPSASSRSLPRQLAPALVRPQTVASRGGYGVRLSSGYGVRLSSAAFTCRADGSAPNRPSGVRSQAPLRRSRPPSASSRSLPRQLAPALVRPQTVASSGGSRCRKSSATTTQDPWLVRERRPTTPRASSHRSRRRSQRRGAELHGVQGVQSQTLLRRSALRSARTEPVSR